VPLILGHGVYIQHAKKCSLHQLYHEEITPFLNLLDGKTSLVSYQPVLFCTLSWCVWSHDNPAERLL